jgi:hypothetical protein
MRLTPAQVLICRSSLVFALALAAAGCNDDSPMGPGTSANQMTFFVTSATSMTANLGGLRGADETCLRLATAVGAGGRTWRAYLSAERDPDNGNRPTNARDRIGSGPWINANGVTIANTSAELHARTGNVDVFVDERGQRINGQWPGSPTPNEHDILTGSDPQGMFSTAGGDTTCGNWSSGGEGSAIVGHHDRSGLNKKSRHMTSWNSSHGSRGCSQDNLISSGGAGLLYCFVAN